MRYDIIGNTNEKPEIAILCPRLQTKEIERYYYQKYLSKLDRDVLACDLFIDKTKKKTSVKHIKEYLEDLIPELLNRDIKLLVVTHPDYFKVLTKKSKTDATIGDVVDTVVPGLHATYCPNYSRIFFDPDKIKEKIKLSLNSVERWFHGDSSSIGDHIIKYEKYPLTDDSIIETLEELLDMDCDLTCDIEGFSLKHYDAGIGTITFCWSKHEGVAFPVDYQPAMVTNSSTPHKGMRIENPKIRKALKAFFTKFTNKVIYHNICYDAYVLIYQLFMDDILDQEGMLEGMDIMLRNWDCTQLITYLATNSCAGNELSLKAQAQAFAGNYAQEDIHDITLISMDDLLKYNLIDGLSTWYVFEKNHPIMIKDQQENLYNEIFKPAVKDIIQMQLTGMPINMDKVIKLNKKLTDESNSLLESMNNTILVSSFMYELEEELIVAKNKKLKKKQITRADLGSTKDTTISFNPNSSTQLQRLLYSEDFLGLPVIDLTDTKLPSTGADTLEKLQKHTEDEDIITFLDLLIQYKASAIILSTFLPAFLKAHKGKDGWHYLFGNFRLGGTVSGRLSSNNPNLQNIPSSGSSSYKKRLAKMIKECFEAPPGWLFVGLDFDSLEDKISAVTTRDPMKIKVYSDGYDGHCLRALSYFPDQMPDIELCPEDSKAYLALVGGKEVYFHSNEIIEYQNKFMTGEELFTLINEETL